MGRLKKSKKAPRLKRIPTTCLNTPKNTHNKKKGNCKKEGEDDRMGPGETEHRGEKKGWWTVKNSPR